MWTTPRRLAGVVGIAGRMLLAGRLRTLLAVCGIALAVLAITLLMGTGLGVLETGEQEFERAGGDLWVTGPAAEFTVVGGGGFENTITDSHEVVNTIRDHEAVSGSAQLTVQSVYVGTGDGEFQSIVGAGIGHSGMITIEEGPGFSHEDQHYADGEYDGPLSNEVVLDERAAEALDVEIGDTIQLGGTLRLAEEHEYTVVGYSSTIEGLLGAPAVVVHVSELQTLTGTTGQDPAALIAIDLKTGADVDTVQDEFNEEFPEYTVRTNEEQLEAIVGTQAVVLAAGVSLVILAVVAGMALAANLLAMLVYHQRAALSALKAIGLRQSSLVTVAIAQGTLLGFAGGILGIVATPPGVRLLDLLGARTVGFEGLVQMEPWVLAVGLAIATAMGMIASGIAAWRISRLPVIGETGRRC